MPLFKKKKKGAAAEPDQPLGPPLPLPDEVPSVDASTPVVESSLQQPERQDGSESSGGQEKLVGAGKVRVSKKTLLPKRFGCACFGQVWLAFSLPQSLHVLLCVVQAQV